MPPRLWRRPAARGGGLRSPTASGAQDGGRLESRRRGALTPRTAASDAMLEGGKVTWAKSRTSRGRPGRARDARDPGLRPAPAREAVAGASGKPRGGRLSCRGGGGRRTRCCGLLSWRWRSRGGAGAGARAGRPRAGAARRRDELDRRRSSWRSSGAAMPRRWSTRRCSGRSRRAARSGGSRSPTSNGRAGGGRTWWSTGRWSRTPPRREDFAERLLAAPRRVEGVNAIGAALLKGVELIEGNRFEGARKVIDLSGDSAWNPRAPTLAEARAAALDAGVVINGLAVLCDDCSGRQGAGNLEQQFRDRVIAGPGAFVVTADGRDGLRRRGAAQAGAGDRRDRCPARGRAAMAHHRQRRAAGTASTGTRAGGDGIDARSGGDRVAGRGGDDRIAGGEGRDRLDGGARRRRDLRLRRAATGAPGSDAIAVRTVGGGSSGRSTRRRRPATRGGSTSSSSTAGASRSSTSRPARRRRGRSSTCPTGRSPTAASRGCSGWRSIPTMRRTGGSSCS